jgi:hypothetical protein
VRTLNFRAHRPGALCHGSDDIASGRLTSLLRPGDEVNDFRQHIVADQQVDSRQERRQVGAASERIN